MGRTEATIQEGIGWGDIIRDLGKGLAEAVSDKGGQREDLTRIKGDRRLLGQMAGLGMNQLVVRPPDGESCLYTAVAVIPVRVNYDKPYDDRSIADWIRPDRRQDHVKLDGLTGARVVPLTVVTFGRDMEIEPIEKALAKGGLRPAIPEEFRDFVEIVKAIPLTLPIAALGSSWAGPDDGRGVLCLDGDERERFVILDWRDNRWNGYWRLLAAPL